MINPEIETLIDFAAAAKNLPRSSAGKPMHAKTIARWALVGMSGVKLETVRVGGRRFTSREACNRFFAALSTVPRVGYPRMKADGTPAGRPRTKPLDAKTRRELAAKGYT